MKKIDIPLLKVFVFCDTAAHIIALKKSPSRFPPPFKRYYADINSTLFQIGEKTKLRNYLVLIVVLKIFPTQ